MITVTKKKSQSNEQLLRAFTNKVKSSQLVSDTKKRRYFEKEPNVQKRRKQRKKQRMISNQLSYLLKTGRIKEVPRRGVSRLAQKR